MVMYSGQMNVNATEFKARCLSLIDRAANTGETITITKRGRVVAKLIRATAGDERPWMALRQHVATWQGDPLAPAIAAEEIEAHS